MEKEFTRFDRSRVSKIPIDEAVLLRSARSKFAYLVDLLVSKTLILNFWFIFLGYHCLEILFRHAPARV
jgi:hypothetical protein